MGALCTTLVQFMSNNAWHLAWQVLANHYKYCLALGALVVCLSKLVTTKYWHAVQHVLAQIWQVVLLYDIKWGSHAEQLGLHSKSSVCTGNLNHLLQNREQSSVIIIVRVLIVITIIIVCLMMMTPTRYVIVVNKSLESAPFGNDIYMFSTCRFRRRIWGSPAGGLVLSWAPRATICRHVHYDKEGRAHFDEEWGGARRDARLPTGSLIVSHSW